ncbi:hypothetical protein TH8_05060 [Thalassospira profundimaris]|nr:hypothetical protein TH8_05060 [Thalassospira profundimaris]
MKVIRFGHLPGTLRPHLLTAPASRFFQFRAKILNATRLEISGIKKRATVLAARFDIRCRIKSYQISC